MAILTLTSRDGTGGYVLPIEGDVDPVDALLNQLIVVENADVAEYLSSALTDHIIPTLDEMTGGSFAVVAESGLTGVIRVRVAGGLADTGYRITAGQSTDTLIEGGSWRGCRNGLFLWLQHLGVHQLLPDVAGELWRVVPARDDLRLVLSETKTPVFQSMAWGATGPPSTNEWPIVDGQPYPHQEARFAFLDWMCRPVSHYITSATPAERAMTGIQYDPHAYAAKTAQFNALGDEAFGQKAEDWEQDRDYIAGNFTAANGHVYLCQVDGTSDNSGTGPSGTGTGITDGTTEWNWSSTPERQLLSGTFHMTHDGDAFNATPGSPVPSDYDGTEGVLGVYTDHLNELAAAEALIYSPINDGLKMGLSVALGDGGGGCRCRKCMDLLRGAFGLPYDSTATDRSLWRNGRMASIVEAANPGKDFTFWENAYDQQSAPPTAGYPIHSSLNVQVSQFAFANDGYAEQVSYELWGERAALDGFDLSVYDFWGLGQYTASFFTFNAYQAWGRIRHWHAHGPTSMIVTESSWSSGSVGMHWWGALRLCWDPTLTDAALMAEFCSAAFGAGAAPMQTMLTRWWGKTWPRQVIHDYEMALSFDDLQAADALVVADAGSRKRVAAWGYYVLYMYYAQQANLAAFSNLAGTAWAPNTAYSVLGTIRRNGTSAYKLYRLTQAGTSAASGGPSGTGTGIVDNTCRWEMAYDMEALVETLLVHTWRGALTFMVDCKWVHDSYIFLGGGNVNLSPTFLAKWTIPGSSAGWPAWRATNGITPYADSEIRAAVDGAAAELTLPVRDVVTAPITTALTAPFNPTGSADPGAVYGFGNEGPAPDGAQYLFQVRPSAAGILRFNLKGGNDNTYARVRLINAETEEEVSSEIIHCPKPDAGVDYDFDLTAMDPGFYKVFLENGKALFRYYCAARPDTPIMKIGEYERVNWTGGPLGIGGGNFAQFFWVPKGMTRLYFFGSNDPSTSLLAWFDGDDTPVTPVRFCPYVWEIPVAAGQDQCFWQMRGNPVPNDVGGTPRFLNIANWYAPTREQGIVPTNLYTE